MAIVDVQERQITLKIMYWGPPLAGKTTNLVRLAEIVPEDARGRLMPLGGGGERTLFFDLLPLFFEASGLGVHLKVYTVPGRPAHQMTRRAVLRGVDGVVFVAHSDAEQKAQNLRSYIELQENLARLGVGPGNVAMLTQFNKRDVASPVAPQSFGQEPMEEATAESGQGVLRTFSRLVEASWAIAETQWQLNKHFGVSEEDFASAMALHLGRAP